MTGLGKLGYDILGEPVDDYDVVWKATKYGGLVLSCVKKVQVKYDRVNPQWSYYSNNTAPRRISGIEDKILYVFTNDCNLNKALLTSGTFREDTLRSVIKVDPYILNSQLVHELRLKAQKVKK